MQLEIQHLHKYYGKKAALQGLDFTLSEGIYGLIGPNGAGKSTLMNIMTNNLAPSSGRILLDGKDIHALGGEYRSRIGYMPQQQTYYPLFTVEQFLFYMASLRGMKKGEAQQRINWALEILSLTEVRRSPIKSLSGGMIQRLLLAQAIIGDPDILILDEPTAGLDPGQRVAVRNLIAEIAMHKIVLISTHVVSDVSFIAKDLILLSDGKILQKGSPAALTDTLRGRVWELDVEEAQLHEMEKFGQISSVAQVGRRIVLRLLAEQKPPVPCQCADPTLEDVYLYHFGSGDTL